jgi:hypothetical protein
MSEPRLVKLSAVRGENSLWARVRLGMTPEQIEMLGISWCDLRHKLRHGSIAFDPPLGPTRLGRQLSQRVTRPCIRCRRPFRSEGVQHRMCRDCRHMDTSPFEP